MYSLKQFRTDLQDILGDKYSLVRKTTKVSKHLYRADLYQGVKDDDAHCVCIWYIPYRDQWFITDPTIRKTPGQAWDFCRVRQYLGPILQQVLKRNGL